MTTSFQISLEIDRFFFHSMFAAQICPIWYFYLTLIIRYWQNRRCKELNWIALNESSLQHEYNQVKLPRHVSYGPCVICIYFLLNIKCIHCLASKWEYFESRIRVEPLHASVFAYHCHRFRNTHGYFMKPAEYEIWFNILQGNYIRTATNLEKPNRFSIVLMEPG